MNNVVQLKNEAFEKMCQDLLQCEMLTRLLRSQERKVVNYILEINVTNTVTMIRNVGAK